MKNAYLLLCLALLTASSCARTQPDRPPAALKTVADYFTFHLGGRAIHIQVAVTRPEMERGLMERKDLGHDDGMIFVFDKPQQMDFWMHDTPTALDIGFFDPAGKLEEIYQMQPFDESTTASHSKNLQLALEMNEGWFVQNGVKPGAQLDFAELDAALKARGFDPKDLGLAEPAGTK